MKAGDWVILNHDTANQEYSEGDLGQVVANRKSEGETIVMRIRMDKDGSIMTGHPDFVTIIDPAVADIIRSSR